MITNEEKLVKGEEIEALVDYLMEEGHTPMHGVFILISTLSRILETNGYSRMEMCRAINESIMTVEKQEQKGPIQ